MPRLSHLLIIAATAAVLGCAKDPFVEEPAVPTAGIRFVHAVPDTGAMDFRFVDKVENNSFSGITFRSPSTAIYYQPAEAGSRKLRIFMNGTTAAVASTVVKDTTVNLVENKLYTFILHGYARAGSAPAMKLTVIEEAPPDPASQVALRVINLAGDLGTFDVFAFKHGTQPASTPTWAGVGPFQVSSYVQVAPDSIRYRVTPSGGGASLFSDQLAPLGTAGTVDVNPVPGTRIAGSAVTGFILPRSVAGSQAPASFTAPGMVFVWDRRPPNTSK